MTQEDFKKCPECGTPVGVGETQCRNGHLRPTIFGDTCALDSEVKRLDIADSGLGGKRYIENTLFECVRCNRLLETQVYHERVVVPRYCAWCGKPISTILGRELDGYRIDELLAKGGFGLIYLASNIAQPKMKAVVKFLRPQMAYSRPELVRIFVEEARLTEEIGQTCWNVVRVSNVREKPWPYYLMEYIRGATLDEIIENLGSKKIPMHECKGYLRGIAKALAATHSHRRVHRDLKPLNIMVIKSQDLPEERIKFLDFGLAMRIAKASLPPTNISGTGFTGADEINSPVQSAGTPEYMAPEAYDGITEFGGDIYSFGVTVYEILTGKRPWDDPPPDGERFLYWRDAHKSKPPRPVRELRPDCSTWLAKVVMKCLEKNPQNRIKDAEQLSAMLREPRSFWAKVGIAAVLLVVAVLVIMVIVKPPKVNLVHTWKVGGREKTFSDPLDLWIQGEKDLPNMDVRATVGSEEVLHCESSKKNIVNCKILSDNTIQLQFVASPALTSLIRNSVEITGYDKAGPFKGIVHIGFDNEEPKVDDLKYVVEKNEPKAITPGLRLSSNKVRLALSIKEDHLSHVFLHWENSQRGWQEDTSPIEVSPTEAKEFYMFKIPAEVQGTYVVTAVAFDLAGNRGTSKKPAEFLIDNKVDFELNENDEPYLARDHVFYKFRIFERLQDMKVVRQPSKEPVAYQIYPASSLSSSLDLSRRLREMEPLTLQMLAPGADSLYLLAVPVSPAAEKTAAKAAVEVSVTDFAITPNESRKILNWRMPIPPSDGDIQKITIQLEKDDPSISTPDHSLDTKLVDGGVFRAVRPIQSSRVKQIVVSVAKEKIHESKCAWKDQEKDGRVEEERVVFEDLPLEVNKENDFSLTLSNAFGQTLTRHLFIMTDRVGPTITMHYKDLAQMHYRMDSWDQLEFYITSNKPLSRAELQFKDFNPIVGKVDDGPRRMRFKFDLDDLPLKEGKCTFRVVAQDLALNKSEESREFHVNTSPPRIGVVDAVEEDGTYKLKNNVLVLEIKDNNEIDYSSAKVLFAVNGVASAKEVPIVRPPKESDLHRISLDQLPAQCDGSFTVKIADKLGLLASNKIFQFQFSRPKRPWQRYLKNWKGMEWVRVNDFYVSKYEISNAVFKDASFFQDGKYVDSNLKYSKPRYWGSQGEFPEFAKDGKGVPGDDFPVVGISPEEAEAFGKRVFGGRLPTWEEWKNAAWKEHSGGHYPWLNGKKGRAYCNVASSSELPESPFKTKHYDSKMKTPNGGWVRCGAVEVGFNPFKNIPSNVRASLDYSGEMVHLIGNVGEFVHLGGGFAIAGGDWRAPFDDISIFKETESNPEKYDRDDPEARNARTGFRLVIPLDDDWLNKEAKVGFIEYATGATGE